MKFPYRQLLLCFLLGLLACTMREEDVLGRWQAVSLFENGQRVEVPLDSVSLVFKPHNQYEFTSQGYYREVGHFRVSVRYLFLTDTTHKPSKEHVVKVLHISQDTLKIRMSHQNKEQVLFLARSGQEFM